MNASQPSQPPSPDAASAEALAAEWARARRLQPLYAELAREFVIDAKPCPDLEAGVEAPSPEAMERVRQWLNEMDERVQVHQLRQFLQTTSPVSADDLVTLLQHFLDKTPRSDAIRDKIDFLLVQYFSQTVPTGLDDGAADLAYVAGVLEPVLGKVELRAPVWLNGLDRALDSARCCRSLEDLLHGGVLEQGRKAKAQAGDLFYLPVALMAFTRFGYLMRRIFFRLMHADLHAILDGLHELSERGMEAIDCRRAQFSAEEPIVRLRMICQSWKVMFQAEYSSGQPLRMLVDLRASVDYALGQGKAPDQAKAGAKPKAAPVVKPAATVAEPAAAAAKPAATVAKPAPASKSAVAPAKPAATAAKPATKPVAAAKPATSPAAARAAATAASAKGPAVTKPLAKPAAAPAAVVKPKAKPSAAGSDVPEFEVSSEGDWDAEAGAQPGKKKN